MSMLLNKLTKTAYTWNGAVSHSTTGFSKLGACLDYFAECGTYVGRDQAVVDADMVKIFADDEKTALRIVFGLRLITRKPEVAGIDEAQTGFGRKDEFYKAVHWMLRNKPDLFYQNMHLIPVFGCWKDFFHEPFVDLLDRKKVYELVANNLGDQLLRKYLPQIRSTKNARTDRDKKRIAWAKGFCAASGINYRDYRKIKSSGTGHIWQKQMMAQEWDKINFNGIPGKAMKNHVSQKGKKDKKSVFERHNQIERLKEWVLGQKTVKFTGYPYELTRACIAKAKPNIVQKLIYDRQFETVVEPMRGHKLGNVLACLDISGSMSCEVVKGVSAYDICISMGIAFSMMNTGYFANTVCGFSDSPILLKLAGSMSDRLNIIETDRKFQRVAWGSTNFQGVIDMLVKVRKDHPEIPVSEYPETILVISDMQFNSAGSQTNYEALMAKFQSVGLENTRLIWWFVNGKGTDFPATMDDRGCYIIGGFDPVNIKALMGLTTKKTAETGADFDAAAKQKETPLDGMLNFLNQPVFDLIT